MLTKKSCEIVDDDDLCCTSITCGTEFCVADVLCIAIGLMLMIMILMQAYKIVFTTTDPDRQRESQCRR
ncbi:hypothetical protein evm_009287 [Chilo suppressalis]|nr:hypothetical protein evm_009287 [Chilo suppressalis]